MAVQIAMALARSRVGNTFTMIESVAGITNAAPTPIAARHAITAVDVCATEPARAAMAKIPRPIWSAPLRPKRSPKAPAVNSNPANTNEYESTIHWRSLLEAWRSRAIAGKAMLSDAFAIITVARLVQSTARIDQRRGWPVSSSVGTGSPSRGEEAGIATLP